MNKIKTKVIPARKVRQFYKRFANGEQYIELNSFLGITELDKHYYWQSQKVFNHIATMIELYGDGLTEEELYGRHGLVSLLEPYQREYNRIMNLHSEHIGFATYGYMAVEDGSVDADELCEEGLMAGKILVYRQGACKPEVQKDVLNTEPYLKSAKYCLEQMLAIASIYCEKKQRGKGGDKK
jgi:hypothetical protein